MKNKEYLTIKEASEKWKLSPRYLATLCRNGYIDGTKKENNIWLIPSSYKKSRNKNKDKGDIK